jgi:hypothetical protein
MIKVNVCPSLEDGQYDVDIIKEDGAFTKVMTIYTFMHTKASAIGYALHYLQQHKRDMDYYIDRNFNFNDTIDAEAILEEMEANLANVDN